MDANMLQDRNISWGVTIRNTLTFYDPMYTKLVAVKLKLGGDKC